MPCAASLIFRHPTGGRRTGSRASRRGHGDRRGRLVRLTSRGERTAVGATRLHRDNLRRLLADRLPAEHWDRFAEDIRVLSREVAKEIPRLR